MSGRYQVIGEDSDDEVPRMRPSFLPSLPCLVFGESITPSTPSGLEVTPRPAQRAETSGGGHIGAPIAAAGGQAAVGGVAEMSAPLAPSPPELAHSLHTEM